jgi:hypothetical protein
MNPKRFKAYHHLINKLLAYPDQAAKILDSQPTLIDARLLLVMQQLSNQFKVKGFSEKAYFLSSLVAQLKDELMPIETKKPEKRSPYLDESSRSDNDLFKKSQRNESNLNWNKEWQKFKWKAKKISIRDKEENLCAVQSQETFGRSKWISLLMLIVFLILSGGVFWYRVSGNRLFTDNGKINYPSSVQTIVKYYLDKYKHGNKHGN